MLSCFLSLSSYFKVNTHSVLCSMVTSTTPVLHVRYLDISSGSAHNLQRTHTVTYVEIKCQLDATEVFIADLIACSTCFGHHPAHHQELKSKVPVNQHHANRTHNHQLHTRPATWKATAQNATRSNHCIILLSSWWWAWWCPKHVEQAIRSAIKTFVASSWHFISTY